MPQVSINTSTMPTLLTAFPVDPSVVHRMYNMSAIIGLLGRGVTGDSGDSAVQQLNNLLLVHFSEPSTSGEQEARVDFVYVQDLLNRGADINVTDEFGQTLLHEVKKKKK